VQRSAPGLDVPVELPLAHLRIGWRGCRVAPPPIAPAYHPARRHDTRNEKRPYGRGGRVWHCTSG
jgi:hypothetical protein